MLEWNFLITRKTKIDSLHEDYYFDWTWIRNFSDIKNTEVIILDEFNYCFKCNYSNHIVFKKLLISILDK